MVGAGLLDQDATAGRLMTGSSPIALKAGDVIGAPAVGDAHQIINSSGEELRYVAIDNHGRADVIEYPDSGRIAVDIMQGNDREPAQVFSVAGTLSPLDYWDGEDIG